MSGNFFRIMVYSLASAYFGFGGGITAYMAGTQLVFYWLPVWHTPPSRRSRLNRQTQLQRHRIKHRVKLYAPILYATLPVPFFRTTKQKVRSSKASQGTSCLLPMVPAPSLEFSGMHASKNSHSPTQPHFAYYDN
jgi:hypothetical protein